MHSDPDNEEPWLLLLVRLSLLLIDLIFIGQRYWGRRTHILKGMIKNRLSITKSKSQNDSKVSCNLVCRSNSKIILFLEFCNQYFPVLWPPCMVYWIIV